MACRLWSAVHVTMDKTDFQNLCPLITPRKVRGVGGTSIEACGIGSVVIKLDHTGTELTLNNVLWIPESSVRLLSIATISDNLQCVSRFSSASITIIANHGRGRVLATGTRIPARKLYRLECSKTPSVIDSAFVSTSPTADVGVWHHRLGHPNIPAILHMARHASAAGIPINLSTLPPVCSSCILGKQPHSSVPKVREGPRATERLQVC